MQDYTYSIFSMSALALHLIFNWNIVFGRKLEGALGRYYRFFLIGVLAYYVSDAAWGIFAGLGWVAPWYADTIFFFLSLVAFIFLWGRFVATYLGFSKWPKRFLDWLGYAILAFNVAAIAANPFTHCFFYFDAGVYKTGFLRDPAFFLLIAVNMVAALAALANAARTKNAIRRRSAMVFLCGLVVSSAMTMQIVWPLRRSPRSGAWWAAYSCTSSCCRTNRLRDTPWSSRRPSSAPARPTRRGACSSAS